MDHYEESERWRAMTPRRGQELEKNGGMMQVESQGLMRLRMPDGVEQLDRVMEGYQAYQVLTAALDLGVFEWLDRQGPADRNKVAEGIGINGMFARSFLDALAEGGFLVKRGDDYANSKTTVDFLLSRSTVFQGDWICSGGRGKHWNDLSTSLRRREPEMDDFNAGPSPSFIASLGQGAVRGELQAVTETIRGWDGFYGSRRLLDLGGGHGLYAIALCQSHPHLEGVIFDKPHVIDTTKQYLEAYRMRDRLTVQPGDLCTDELGRGYDIVIISHLLYKFRRDLERILEKIKGCLNPEGLLASNHWFCATGCAPESSGIQELAKALQSFGHPLCHEEDFQRLFHKQGFRMLSATEVSTAYGRSRLHLAAREPEQGVQIAASTACCSRESKTPGHCCAERTEK